MRSVYSGVMVPFEEVVRRHGATVLRVCRAVVGPFDAEDVWSETFLAALRAYPELPVGANVQAWLVTIARRKSIDLMRARSRTPQRAELTELAELRELAQPSSDMVHFGTDVDELWRALRALPEKQRAATVLHHLGGLPYAEVAEILGGTADAARRAAADAMRTLRRVLPEREEAVR